MGKRTFYRPCFYGREVKYNDLGTGFILGNMFDEVLQSDGKYPNLGRIVVQFMPYQFEFMDDCSTFRCYIRNLSVGYTLLKWIAPLKMSAVHLNRPVIICGICNPYRIIIAICMIVLLEISLL